MVRKKKSHPNCWNISGAGHIRAEEKVLDGAIRELREELGVIAQKNDLKYIATIKSIKNPKNKEFQYVYLLKCNNKIEDYVFEDNEVSEVKYVFYEKLEKIKEILNNIKNMSSYINMEYIKRRFLND